MEKEAKLKLLKETLQQLYDINTKLNRSDVIYDTVIRHKLMGVIEAISEWNEWLKFNQNQ
jgi:hypothetical protein